LPARPLDLSNPRAVFVWMAEAREVIDDLAAVAAEALRPPCRRKLTRSAAKARYRRARAAAAWLFSMPLDAPAETAPPADVAASWKGWEA